MVIQRGEVWWADLEEPTESEPGYRRPVLIIQSNHFNQSGIDTVIVAALTSHRDRADAPGNVAVSRRHSGLPRDSVANVSQIATIDRRRLIAKVGRLPDTVMAHVDAGICIVLSLSP